MCMNFNVIVIMCIYEGLFSHAAALWCAVSPVGKAGLLSVSERRETMSPGDHAKIPHAWFSLQVAGVPPLI